MTSPWRSAAGCDSINATMATRDSLSVLLIAALPGDVEEIRGPIEEAGDDLRVSVTTALVEAAPAAAWHDVLVLAHPSPEAGQSLRHAMTDRAVSVPLVVLLPQGSSATAAESGADAVLPRDAEGLWKATLPGLVRQLAARHADRAARDAAEADLSRQRALFDGFMRHSPAIAYLKDEEGRYAWVNAAFEQFFDLDEDEWRGRTDADIWGEEAGRLLRENDLAVLQAGEALEVEDVVPMEDGIHHWLAYKFPWRDEQGRTQVGGMAVDVTPLRRAEEERRQVEARLRQAHVLESLGALASSIAHEFNRILASILADAGRAMTHAPAGSPQAQALDRIERSAVRAADLTHHLLAMTGRARLLLEPVRLQNLVEARSFALQGLLPRGARLKLEFDVGAPDALGDPTQIERILTTLVLRSASSMRDPGGAALPGSAGTIAIRCRQADLDPSERALMLLGESLPEGPVVVLEVEDDGEAPEDPASLLEPGVSSPADAEEAAEGGMPSLLGLVRGMGGALSAERGPAGGVLVRLALPLAPAGQDVEDTVPGGRPSPLHADAPRSSVLVVDDDEAVRAGAGAALQRDGWKPLLAQDGDEALRLLDEHGDAIGAVLLDTTMPGLSGFEVLRRIKQSKPDVKVVLTSRVSRQDVLQQGASPAEAFLPKPHMPRRLLRTLRDVVDPKKT